MNAAAAMRMRGTRILSAFLVSHPLSAFTSYHALLPAQFPLWRGNSVCRPLHNAVVPHARTPRTTLRVLRAVASDAPSAAGTRRLATSPFSDDSHVFGGAQSFGELGVHPDLVSALEKLGVSRPTQVQAAAIPALINTVETDCIIAAETGTGKTLAYIVPLLHALYTSQNPPLPLSSCVPPRALILAPTQELCSQIRDVLDAFRDVAPAFHLPSIVLAGSAASAAGFPEQSGVIISTPSGILRMSRASWFKECRYIVVDEADMLLEGAFLKDVEKVLDTLKPRIGTTWRRRLEKEGRTVEDLTVEEWPGRGRQVVYVGATYPHWMSEKSKSIINWLAHRTPDAKHIRTDGLHQISPRVEQEWIDIQGKNLHDELKRVLLNDLITLGRLPRTMVFANTSKSASSLAKFLDAQAEFHGQVGEVHKDVSSQDRAVALDKYKTGEISILVCTDLASRGLDLGVIDHIIQADFATNVVNHIHRIGRTGRVGKPGRSTNMFHDETRSLATAIHRAQDSGNTLENMFSRNRLFRQKEKKAEKYSTSYSN